MKLWKKAAIACAIALSISGACLSTNASAAETRQNDDASSEMITVTDLRSIPDEFDMQSSPICYELSVPVIG